MSSDNESPAMRLGQSLSNYKANKAAQKTIDVYCPIKSLPKEVAWEEIAEENLVAYLSALSIKRSGPCFEIVAVVIVRVPLEWHGLDVKP